MAPAKKASPSKAPKKAVSKAGATHPSWTDMIKVLTISAIYTTSLLLLHGNSRSFTGLCVVVVCIVFLKRGGFDSGHCRAALSIACVAPTRCFHATGASNPVTISR
jgi:hypothetical protein